VAWRKSKGFPLVVMFLGLSFFLKKNSMAKKGRPVKGAKGMKALNKFGAYMYSIAAASRLDRALLHTSKESYNIDECVQLVCLPTVSLATYTRKRE
jgi:hypothetical protein